MNTAATTQTYKIHMTRPTDDAKWTMTLKATSLTSAVRLAEMLRPGYIADRTETV